MCVALGSGEMSRVVAHRSRVSCLISVAMAIVLAKRRYPKAAFLWLVKRLLGWFVVRLLPVPIPETTKGPGSCGTVGQILKDKGCKKPLIVTDEVLVKHGLLQTCTDSLAAAGCEHEVFDKVVPNPPHQLVDEGFQIYKAQSCDSIVAFGGGSPMDIAKVIGAKVNNPMPVKAYHGFFRATLAGLRPLPPFVAVPTTAGTGSETTVAAVISIPEDSSKIVIADWGLVPGVAVLDPEVLEKLPKSITAATGMDALTHAVESFLSGWSSDFTRRLSLDAVSAIFKYLPATYENGANLHAREEMLQASFNAGLAFTRANLGYVHAIAHTLGGLFHTPHGDANAMLLPHVLEFYIQDEVSGGACTHMYCELAVAAGIADSIPKDAIAKTNLAKEFVCNIRRLSACMNIPTTVSTMKFADVKDVATRALKEAHGELHDVIDRPISWLLDLGYPTPKYMTLHDCEEIVAKVLPID